MKKVLIGFSVLLLFYCSTTPLLGQGKDALAEYDRQPAAPSGEAMAADVLVVRPISILALACGIVVSVAATPFAVASGTAPEVYGRLVGGPFNFAFRRPVGGGF
jgi:hypothetical protein